MEKSINFCSKVAQTSTKFEQNNSSLKKEYLIKNIQLYNEIAKMVTGNRGSFGTGYPFYVLGKDMNGNLPVIDEQIRYNNELIKAVEESKYTTWNCAECLSKNALNMPDLKQICKPCPNMDDALKPRKIINRLPDIDMWLVCEDSYIDSAKEELITLFDKYNMHTSDVNPVQTISDITEITEDLKNGIVPQKLLPIDSHIINYSTFYSLIEQVPDVLKKSLEYCRTPYLPIHPLSYRKVWQYDNEAYNFIHDYLSSFTEYSFDENLQKILVETRKNIADSYSFEQLYNYLIMSGPDSVLRRHKTLELKYAFRERVESWKKQ